MTRIVTSGSLGFTTEQVQDLEVIKYLIKKDALAMAETQLSTHSARADIWLLLGNLEGREGPWV